jgi:hypothetical protein
LKQSKLKKPIKSKFRVTAPSKRKNLGQKNQSISREREKETMDDGNVQAMHKFFIQTPDQQNVVTYDTSNNIILLPVNSPSALPWLFDGGNLGTQYGGILQLDNCAHPTTALVNNIASYNPSCTPIVMSLAHLKINSYLGPLQYTSYYLLLGPVDAKTNIMTFGVTSDPNAALQWSIVDPCPNSDPNTSNSDWDWTTRTCTTDAAQQDCPANTLYNPVENKCTACPLGICFFSVCF